MLGFGFVGCNFMHNINFFFFFLNTKYPAVDFQRISIPIFSPHLDHHVVYWVQLTFLPKYNGFTKSYQINNIIIGHILGKEEDI